MNLFWDSLNVSLSSKPLVNLHHFPSLQNQRTCRKLKTQALGLLSWSNQLKANAYFKTQYVMGK